MLTKQTENQTSEKPISLIRASINESGRFRLKKPGHFAGFASTEVVDMDGDKILAEAFQLSTEEVPLYWEHDPEQKIGYVNMAIPVKGLGLYVEGFFEGESARLLSAQKKIPLSVGIIVKEAISYRNIRIISKVELAEISATLNPKNEEATTI